MVVRRHCDEEGSNGSSITLADDLDPRRRTLRRGIRPSFLTSALGARRRSLRGAPPGGAVGEDATTISTDQGIAGERCSVVACDHRARRARGCKGILPVIEAIGERRCIDLMVSRLPPSEP